MRWRKGRRPPIVWVFSACFLAAALTSLLLGLSRVGAPGWSFELLGNELTGDAAIVGMSAMFTIALIPVVWIFGFGSRFARWFVLLFGLVKLLGFREVVLAVVRDGNVSMLEFLIEPCLITVALLCLLSPAMGDWVGNAKEASPDTFA